MTLAQASTSAAGPRRLSGRVLRLWQGVWVALVALSLAGYLAGIVVRARELRTVCLEPEAACHAAPQRPTPADAALLAASGLTLRTYAALEVGKLVFFSSLWILVGGVVFARRRSDPMGLLTALFLVTFPTGVDGIQDTLVRTYPALLWPRLVLGSLVGSSFILFFALFPNGRWAPRWIRWIVLGLLLSGFLQPVIQAAGRGVVLPTGLALAGYFVLFGFLLLGQVIRYRRHSTAAEQRQTRWVVAGLGACLTVLAVMVVTVTALKVPRLSLGYFVSELVYQSAIALIPLSIGLAILRYRLWDIDILIRRTLIYSVLSALLALAYFGCVVVLESLLRTVTGNSQNQFATVVSTLAIAALSVPLRNRVQGFIDRRFYRQKYDAARTLAAFSLSARDDVDLDDLTARLVSVAQQTLQPRSVSLWLADTQGQSR